MNGPVDHLPQRRVIAASWQRTAMTGLSRQDDPDPRIADITEADPLLDAAAPVLAHAESLLNDTDTALLLVDHECRLVARVSGDRGLTRALDAAGLVPGALTDEDTLGTSGLGTVAEVRGAVTIHSAEHYLEKFTSLSCYGQPIIHPTTNRLAGVLCLTEVSGQASPLSAPVVRSLVDGVTDRLRRRSHADQHALLSAFERATTRRGEAVAVLGTDLQLTNAKAARLLSDADLGTLAMLTDEPHDSVIRMTLTSGLPAEVVVERVPGVAHGALFALRPAPAPTTAAASVPTEPVAASLAITGEPGSGRTTQALDVVGERPHRILDVAAALLAGGPVDVAAELRASRSAGEVLIVDGADLLDDRALSLLTAAAGSSTDPLIVITGRPDDARPGVGALTARCRRRIDVPPLRQRSGELAAVAQGFLNGAAPGLILSSEAVDALASQEWPGNLSELGQVLTDAVASALARDARSVGVADLPPRYRSSTRAARLSGRERAERQAIIEALASCRGNKKRAAEALGVSRTTLYSRIRALGVHG
ncbi:MAG: helix-turn-helix domain-containing protein [Gordonia sp. (in: high G+C Gram-positive bacteria)]|uniref:sigma-54-dependent Fis family transcriptional regulator n=1 Tax=Gordonia sp. (in: high G+C Gram-positive bacteria) TaxID=84139 RepID=UPI0039E2F23F